MQFSTLRKSFVLNRFWLPGKNTNVVLNVNTLLASVLFLTMSAKVRHDELELQVAGTIGLMNTSL